MDKDDAMQTLGRKIDVLCARCEALGREIKRLHAENQALRNKNQQARSKIRHIISQLPENSAQDSRIN